MSCGQHTLSLVWLPLLSSTRPSGRSGNSWRTASRKSWKHTPSVCGRNSTKLRPLLGSTAAYSHSQRYGCSWTQGGRSPKGHHSRRCVTLRPKRASSKASTCSTSSSASVGPKSFFEGRLRVCAGGSVMATASGLQFGLAAFEQLGDGIDAVVEVPAITQIRLRLVEAADLPGAHLLLQPLPRLRRDPFAPARRAQARQQPRHAALPVSPPPV